MIYALASGGELIDDGSIMAKRVFDVSFVYFDIAFLIVFIGLLLWQKKYMTVAVGLIAGVIYLIADYGFFYLLFGERVVLWNGELAPGGTFFWVLFWMSLSYGFTNFAWIWLWVAKDKRLFEWTLLILSWWLAGPLLMAAFPAGAEITTYRTTNTTHGGMAIMLFVGYLILIVWNLKHRDKAERINIPWLLAMGLLVQFGWEAGLLLGGIRSKGCCAEDTLMTVVVNSMLETNLGMPYIYLLFLAYSMRFTERFQRRTQPLSFMERLAENNAETVRGDRISPYFGNVPLPPDEFA